MSIAVPMVWLEARNFLDDLCFCITSITGFCVQSKHRIEYPKIPSALRFAPHDDSVPVPEPPEQYTVDSESEEASPKAGTSTREDENFSAYSTISCDLNLPKTKPELLGPRLQQWNLLEKGVRVSLYSTRQANIASYFSMNGDLVYFNVQRRL